MYSERADQPQPCRGTLAPATSLNAAVAASFNPLPNEEASLPALLAAASSAHRVGAYSSTCRSSHWLRRARLSGGYRARKLQKATSAANQGGARGRGRGVCCRYQPRGDRADYALAEAKSLIER